MSNKYPLTPKEMDIACNLANLSVDKFGHKAIANAQVAKVLAEIGNDEQLREKVAKRIYEARYITLGHEKYIESWENLNERTKNQCLQEANQIIALITKQEEE